MRTFGKSVTVHSTPEPEPVTWPGSEIMKDSVTARVLFHSASGDPATCVSAAPGSGKSRLMVLLALSLAHRFGLRVLVAAQTRAQAADLARRIGSIDSSKAAMLVSSKNKNAHTGATPKITGDRGFGSEGGGIIVATTARLQFADPTKLGADCVLVDEAFQCAYGDLASLGAFAPQIVAAGDSGQINPIVTGKCDRWKRTPTGPQLPGPEALLAAHGEHVTTLEMPDTWRLGPETTKIVGELFYQDLGLGTKRPPEHIETAGTALPEISYQTYDVQSGPTDRGLLAAAAARVRTLLETRYITPQGTRATLPSDLMVVTPHVAQASGIRAHLSDLPEIEVGTANAMQGSEAPVVVMIHPAAGYRELTGFTLDPARLCVQMSRHRAHLTVLSDSLTRDVLHATDPQTPHLDTHHALLNHLEETPSS